jgi:DnaJ family protein B protein 12
MIFDEATSILNIPSNFTHQELKKAYYKAALKSHPDKCDLENADEIFKKVNDAYIFLSNHRGFDDTCVPENNYLFLIKKFIKLIVPNLNMDDTILTETLKMSFSNLKSFSFKLLKNVNRNDLIKLYGFIIKNREFITFNKITIDRLLETIKRNINIDNIIILNPSIDDLLNDNVYKLDIDNTELLVPLWHDEIEFDISDTKILIKNIPELNDNITIDNCNNIIIKLTREVYKLLCDDIEVVLGEKIFKIPPNELKIIKNQKYLKQSDGMLRIDENDLFNTIERGDIIFDITLT